MTDTSTSAERSHPQQYRLNQHTLDTAQGEPFAMPADEHQALAYRTSKHSYPPLTFQQFELIHAVLGMVSELGEIADTIKKHVIYGRDLDTKNLVEEVGDSDWYAALLLTSIQEFRSIALEQNIEKLRKRYPDGYSDLAAAARADKVEEARIANGIIGPRATKAQDELPHAICGTCNNLGQVLLMDKGIVVTDGNNHSIYVSCPSCGGSGVKPNEPKVTSNLMPVCSKCDEPLCKFDNLILCKSELICHNNKCERWGLEGPG